MRGSLGLPALCEPGGLAVGTPALEVAPFTLPVHADVFGNKTGDQKDTP